jgi:hypothetical protein
MRRSNFALRVPPTLLAEARKAAESEGVALNQLIILALQRRSLPCGLKNILRSADGERTPKVSRILSRVGKRNPPIDGDELPPDPIRKKKQSKK